MKQNQLLISGEIAAAVVIIFAMSYFCRTSDSDALKWILAPTAWWAGILGGIYFEYLPHQGYVNYFHRFLIAPSCAGSRFMLLTFLMLAFSFRLSDYLCGDRQVYSERDYKENINMRKEYLWFGFSIVFSYISTVFINGIRIVASVYLPDILERVHLMNGWLTPDRLHTLIGTVTYFSFLCLVYLAAVWLRGHIFVQTEKSSSVSSSPFASGIPERSKQCAGLLVPVFWYLLIVLALPFIKRMYHNEWEGFGQYAVLIVSVCGSVYVLLMVVGRIRRR